jgi:putative phosphoribosyl transferase
MLRRYHDRRDAGRALAAALEELRGQPDVVVIALPRGGVPVAYEIARRLEAPLDVLLVRKLGVPGQEELGFGALTSDGAGEIDRELVQRLGIGASEIEAVVAREEAELARREHSYRGERPPLDVRGRTVILVDDGLATGWSMRAAIAALRRREPARIVVAVPCGAPSTCASIERVADRLICPWRPEPFHAVGLWYERFEQETDEDVLRLLEEARAHRDRATPTIEGSRPGRGAEHAEIG